MVADAAIKLGMNVLGFDPEITVDAAWSLPSQVRRATSVNDVLKQAQFVSLHVPLVECNPPSGQRRQYRPAKPGAVLMNFSREGVVCDSAVIDSLNAGRLGPICLRLSRRRHPRPSAGDCAAAPRRIDPRGRGKLRRDGRRPVARLPRKRQCGQRGQFPAGDDGARIGIPRGHRQCQCAQHAGPDFHCHGAGRPEYPQHGQQVARRHGLYAGRCRQRGFARGAAAKIGAIDGVLAVRYLPAR